MGGHPGLHPRRAADAGPGGRNEGGGGGGGASVSKYGRVGADRMWVGVGGGVWIAIQDLCIWDGEFHPCPNPISSATS